MLQSNSDIKEIKEGFFEEEPSNSLLNGFNFTRPTEQIEACHDGFNSTKYFDPYIARMVGRLTVINAHKVLTCDQ